jgi:hypothetical protein
MSRNQRLRFLGIAAVIAVAAVIVLAGGTGPDQTAEEAASTPTPQQTPTSSPDGGGDDEATPEPTPTPTPRPQPPLLQAGRERTLRFTEGETVRFRARSETQEEIHVHGYDRYVDLPPGKTVNVSFRASITGIFEVELHGSGELIAQLRVDPE